MTETIFTFFTIFFTNFETLTIVDNFEEEKNYLFIDNFDNCLTF